MDYNFYEMGKQYAQEGLVNLKEVSKEIEKKYGKDAKMEFDAGICETIPVYEKFEDFEEFNISEKKLNGTKKYGIPNMCNNSYFGGRGIGIRHTSNPSEKEEYNEVKKR